MVTETIKKSECTGCGACYQICKFGAIVMKADEKGFLYPEVRLDKCTQCGACTKVCVLKNNPPNTSGYKVYAGQKLERIDPETLAQASRIPGVSPSDINVLLILMGR